MTAPGEDRLRIGDAERERAAEALSEHYVAGRLDHDEYSERLDRIWGARTAAELRPVFADLPGPHGARVAPAYSTPVDRGHRVPRRRCPGLPAPLVLVLVALVALTVLTHLPIILVGLVVWFVLVKGGTRRPTRRW